MKILNERIGLATYGIAQGCSDGCCRFYTELNGKVCSIQFPYQVCKPNGAYCITDQACCSNNCTKEPEEPYSTCKSTSTLGSTVNSRLWVPKCDFELNLDCLNIAPDAINQLKDLLKNIVP